MEGLRQRSFAAVSCLCVVLASGVTAAPTAAHAQAAKNTVKAMSVEDWKAFDARYRHPDRASKSVQAVFTVYDLKSWSMHFISSSYVFPDLSTCEQNLVTAYLAVSTDYSQQGVDLQPVGPEEFIAKNLDGGPKVFKAWCGTPRSSTSTIIPDPAKPYTDSKAVMDYGAKHKLGKPTLDWGSMAAIVHPEDVPKK